MQSSLCQGLYYYWNSWKTPGVLKFFPGPWKTPLKFNFGVNSWKTPWIYLWILGLKKYFFGLFFFFVSNLFSEIYNFGVLDFFFPAHGTSSTCRYEERKAKKQDTAENELQIESLCLTNGGNHYLNKVRQLVFLVYYLAWKIDQKGKSS